jgi:hemoglobin
MQANTLFDRIGGAAAVTDLVSQFYEKVLADPELAPFFSHVGMDKQRHMQAEFFAAALGGPVAYSGRPIVHAHQNLGITLVDYQRFVKHLFETLSKFDLTDDECYEIIGRLNLYTNDIVSFGVDSAD